MSRRKVKANSDDLFVNDDGSMTYEPSELADLAQQLAYLVSMAEAILLDDDGKLPFPTNIWMEVIAERAKRLGEVAEDFDTFFKATGVAQMKGTTT